MYDVRSKSIHHNYSHVFEVTSGGASWRLETERGAEVGGVGAGAEMRRVEALCTKSVSSALML